MWCVAMTTLTVGFVAGRPGSYSVGGPPGLCNPTTLVRPADNLIHFAWRIGAAAVRNGHASIGIKRMLYPVGYWRYPVFRRVQSILGDRRGLKILDVGSPKLLSLWLAAERDCDVW